MSPSKKAAKKDKPKLYTISIVKTKDFSLDDILEWIDYECKKRTHNHKKYKNNVVFFFHDIDDAFKFKLRWEIA